MSYDLANKKKRNQKVRNVDDEAMANPLLSKNQVVKSRQIEQQMNQFKQKIRTLEEFHRGIGTDKDNHKFRQLIEQALKETSTIMKTCQESISAFIESMEGADNLSQMKD